MINNCEFHVLLLANLLKYEIYNSIILWLKVN